MIESQQMSLKYLCILFYILYSYGSLVGLVICLFLMYVSDVIGKQFEELNITGEKVGEPSKALSAKLAAMQNLKEDTSCSLVEEGQSDGEMKVCDLEVEKTV